MSNSITDEITHELVEDCEQFLADYYREAIATLAQSYPQEQRSLTIDYSDVVQFDPDIADDLRTHPSALIPAFEDALPRVDIPLDIDLSDAHVRVVGLPEHETHFPGGFSPSDAHGSLVAIEGELSKATDDYSRMVTTTFRCKRCGSETVTPQPDNGFREPHECQGCDRQGPFEINYEQSEFVDAQKLRLRTPPEEAQGDGTDIDAYVEDDLADVVTVGDRVILTGIVAFDQAGQNSQQNKFEPYLEGRGLTVEQTDATDLDISAAEREHIEALAAGDHGDPLELAADSYAPKIYGHEDVKQALVLALVGGARAEYGGGDFDRGEFHVLLIGDPSTAKSKLVTWGERIGWRAVGVSGKGATVAGVTATAVQDDFGDGSWTLDAGAAVKAHRGVLAIDELDDMPAEVRAALLEPMSKQTIHVTKGGVNATLPTRTAVIAAANPVHGRFDPYEPWVQQFDLSSALLQRFDLIFTFVDEPDEETDERIGGHILDTRDAAKREQTDDDVADTPVDADTLRAWIALAKQQPKPVFADDAVRDHILESFTDLRGLHGYDDGADDPVPVTFRSLEGIVRIAEAAAKLEFSATIEQRHIRIATNLVGESMQDIGRDPDTGDLDADIVETGASASQRERRKHVAQAIRELHDEYDGNVPIEVVADHLDRFDESTIREDIDHWKQQGEAIEPETDHVRYIGRA